MGLSDLWGNLFEGKAEAGAAQKNIQALDKYKTDATGALTSSYGEGKDALGNAIQAFAPLKTLAGQYQPASQLQLDAIGANGAEGTQRASTAMQATPGFDLGQEAVARRRAISGSYDSGGTDTDLSKFISSQIYAPWMQNVTQAAQMGGQYATTAAGGEAGGFTNLANLGAQYGQNLTGVYGNVASGTMDANKLEASGQAAGAKNLLGAGLSLATLAVGGNPFGGSLTGGGGGGGGSGGFNWGGTPIGQAVSGVKNMNLGQNLFGGGSPTGYGNG